MMVAIEQTDNLDETALRILEAASDRFLHYGYGKTTMSEIAKDCNMSTGNLYPVSYTHLTLPTKA